MVGWKKWKACAPDCPQQPVQQLTSEMVWGFISALGKVMEELSCFIVALDGISLASSSTVRNLGLIFEHWILNTFPRVFPF